MNRRLCHVVTMASILLALGAGGLVLTPTGVEAAPLAQSGCWGSPCSPPSGSWGGPPPGPWNSPAAPIAYADASNFAGYVNLTNAISYQNLVNAATYQNLANVAAYRNMVRVAAYRALVNGR
jgi:hypothetical protein